MTTLDERPQPSAATIDHGAGAPAVIRFEDGDASMAGLMGGKGANLAEMTRLGLPLPTGFTLTTELCREFLREGRLPASLPEQIRHAVTQMEARTGRIFGAPTDPLLVSVRSGARFSMPGPRSGRAAVGWTGSDPRGPAEQSAVTRRHVRKAVGK